MKRFIRALVMVVPIAGFVGAASLSFAANDVECSTMKDGKKATQMVESREACTKLGGTVTYKAKPAAPASKASPASAPKPKAK